MGQKQSKEEPPSLEFEEEWRKTPWEEKERLENNLKTFQLSNPKVEYVRILVVGQVGSGKSSFINSVNSVFQRRITTNALANATANAGKSFTKIYTTYNIKSGESILPFGLTDIMGLEESDGVQTDDIVKALDGFIKERYKFNPVSPVSAEDQGFRSNPRTCEKALCLIYIVAADKISLMGPEVLRKINIIREEASERGIPQAIVMTRVDEICPLVKENVKKIYTSKKIKEKMQECSSAVGVPMSHVYPVKNYHEEIDTKNDIDVLILRAFTHIVQIANDKLSGNNTISNSE